MKSEHSQGLISPVVHSIMFDSKRRHWVCTDGGLSLLDGETNTFLNFEQSVCRFATELPNGLLLVGTNSGLRFWNPDTFEWSEFDAEMGGPPIENFDFLCYYEDSEQRIWIGSRNHGIFFYEPETNRLQSLREVKLVNGNMVQIDFSSQFY